jgi:hypothetical protein
VGSNWASSKKKMPLGWELGQEFLRRMILIFIAQSMGNVQSSGPR